MAAKQPDLVRKIRREASRLGFAAIGFSSPREQKTAIERYEQMIREKRHGDMTFLEKHLQERANPEILLPGLKTIISTAISYNIPIDIAAGKPKISRYALAGDYHVIIRSKLEELGNFLAKLFNEPVKTAVAVDSSPVLEKTWAEQSGIGRPGKNTLLIVPSAGSYIFLGELLIDREITDIKQPLPYPCGGCNSCLENCPTGALLEAGKIDATKCISYLTIEMKREFTPEESTLIGDNLFGCDRCQEVCPYNMQAIVGADDSFVLKKSLLDITAEEIRSLTKSGFRDLFSGTPVYRIGLRRLKRNARAVAENISGRKKAQ
ncbi:MAG: tRNA epoxyqueuosine(34) reductase QueG [Chlorobiaceae bacterium]|nr:tRNA epoxyqueuosine(34) reductase QueG [Chlorobiaceae bacterium]